MNTIKTEQEIVRPYPEYKPSGSQWIGEIPSHWRSTAIKRVSQTGSGGTPPTGQQEYYGEGIPWVTSSELREQTITSTTETISERAISEIASLKLHSKGSVVIAMYGATIGRLGILGTPATVNQACCACKASQHINSNFLYHWLLANKDNLSALGQGGGQPNLSQEIIREFPIVLPPLEEQAAIVRFLNHADEQIQRYIASKERLIALLEEERQALVHQAVTRGLDPSVRLKPSGVEWLGQVPEHWETLRVRHFSKVGNGCTPQRDNAAYWTEGVHPWLNSSSVNQGTITKADQFVTDLALSECHLPRLRPGSVLVGITGQGKTRGMSAVLCMDATINQHMAFITLKTGRVSSHYLHMYLTAAYSELRAISNSSGSTKDALTCEDIKHFMVVLPPRDEQERLLSEVRRELASVDNAVDLARRQIDLMNEYRTRLIADVVTGQLDVREAAAQLPAAP